MELNLFLAYAIPLAVCAALHYLPFRLAGKNLGVDHWFWIQYIESARKQKQFPPTLPQYRLEKEQWYPPVFPLLLSQVSPDFFRRHNNKLAALLNLCRLLLLLQTVYFLTDGKGTSGILIAGLVYATCPILISYNIQLNPRVLGAIFLDGAIVILLLSGTNTPGILTWVLICFLSGLILLTHKMTTQLLWFLCLAAGIFFGEGLLIALIPISIFVAWVLSMRFYEKVLIAHWNIVAFWNRNWKWLQAHPLRESPVYGEPDYESPTKFYQKGWTGFKKHLKYFFGYFPGVWLLLPWMGAGFSGMGPANILSQNPIAVWLVIIILFALGTVFIPFMRCVGSGYYYLYNAAFPASLILGQSMDEKNTLMLVLAILTTHAVVLFFYLKGLSGKVSGKVVDEIDDALNFIKQLPAGTVMCLPPQWYDRVAYQTQKPVLFGGHGYPFEMLEPTFPRILVPLDELVPKHDIHYLFTEEGYLPESFSKTLPEEKKTFGKFQVYFLKEKT